MGLVKATFWLAAALVAYVYVGYPLLLAAWARLRARPAHKRPDAPLPAVSIIIAARNEEGTLPGRLRNLLALDYPPALRQIVVVSDGSTDATAAVASRFAPAVELVTRPAQGKAAALNAGVERARHDILVFCDARQRFAPDAVRHLVANFADPTVGAVSGELVIADGPASSSIGEGVGLYWQYEKWLRRHESLVGSTLGVTGAIYAMRRECRKPLPPATILDDVLAPMRVVLEGRGLRRVVFDSCAVAYDEVSPDAAVEWRRKTRTLAGNFQLMWLEPRLLLPVVNPVWLQFVSHKIARLFVPYALLACLFCSLLLATSGVVYAAALVGQLLVAALAVYGALLDRRARSTPRPAVASNPLAGDRRRSKRVVNA